MHLGSQHLVWPGLLQHPVRREGMHQRSAVLRSVGNTRMLRRQVAQSCPRPDLQTPACIGHHGALCTALYCACTACSQGDSEHVCEVCWAPIECSAAKPPAVSGLQGWVSCACKAGLGTAACGKAQ